LEKVVSIVANQVHFECNDGVGGGKRKEEATWMRMKEKVDGVQDCSYHSKEKNNDEVGTCSWRRLFRMMNNTVS
jgi:hypothetical protein